LRRRLLGAVAGVLLSALLLKLFVIDGYRIRGNSMQPVLIDRRDGADHIAVVKPYYDIVEPRRFDLIVFGRPSGNSGARSSAAANGAGESAELSGDLFIKRVLGLPGESVRVRAGDIYLADRPEGPYEILRKPIDVVLKTLIPVPGTAWSVPSSVVEEGDSVELDAPETVRYGEMIADGWRDCDGTMRKGPNAVNDIGLEVRVEPLKPGTRVRLELREQGDVFELELSDSSDAKLVRRKGPSRVSMSTERFGTSRLSVGRTKTVLFLNVDDRVAVLVDGRLVLAATYDGNTEIEGHQSNEPSFGVVTGRASFGQPRIWRDVFVTSEGDFGITEPCSVPPGSFFVLGDNSAKSRDSRHFGAVPEQRIEGRPLLIFLPAHRARIL